MQRRQCQMDVGIVRKKAEGRLWISGHNALDENPDRSGILVAGGPTLVVRYCLYDG